jgi:hypothetical protein
LIPKGKHRDFPFILVGAAPESKGQCVKGAQMTMQMTKFSDKRIDVAQNKAIEAALAAAIRHQICAFDYVVSPIPEVFGERWRKAFGRERERLIEKHGDKTANLFALAQRSYIYSITHSATFMREMLISAGTVNIVEGEMASLEEPQSYADTEGWAYTLFNGVCAEINKPQAILQACALKEFPEDSCLLSAMGIVWFFMAGEAAKDDRQLAMDSLFEAANALMLSNSLDAFEAGSELAKEETPSVNPAVELAKKRHTENYAMIGNVVKYWHENIDKNLSASKAADELLKVVPLSHKKLAEVVAAEKKKLAEVVAAEKKKST